MKEKIVIKLAVIAVGCMLVAMNSHGATYYCTQAGSGDATGSSYANSMTATAFNAKTDWAPGDVIYLCDTFTNKTITPRFHGTVENPITLRGDYTGHACILDGNNTATIGMYASGATNQTNLIIRNIEIKNMTDGGISLSKSAPDSSANWTLQNIYIHDIGITNTNSYGVLLVGSDTKILNSTITNVGGDGIYVVGSRTNIGYNTITKISEYGSTGEGDNIQHGTAATQQDSIWIHHNTLDHSDQYSKSCIMITHLQHAVVEYNTIIGRKLGVNFAKVNGIPVNFVLRNNFFSGRSKNHVVISGVSGSIYDNIFTAGADTATSDAGQILIDTTQAADTLNVYNNDFYNSAKSGLVISTTNASAVTNHYNNIYHTMTGRFLEILSTAPTFNSDNNIYYNSSAANPFRKGSSATAYTTLSAFQSATGMDTHSTERDPKLANVGTGNFIPNRGSVAIRKGKYVGVPTDYAGTVRGNRPTVGAFEVRWVRPSMGEISTHLGNEQYNSLGL